MLRLHPLWAAGKCAVQTTPLAVCVVLSALSILLWARSYSAGYRYLLRSSSIEDGNSITREFYTQSAGGGFRLSYVWYASKSPAEMADYIGARNRGLALTGLTSYENPAYPRIQGARDESILLALGMQLNMFSDSPNEALRRETTMITLPWWVIVGLLGAYPVLKYVNCVIRRQQEDRAAIGLCPRCGEPVNEFIAACRGCDRPVGILTNA